MSSSSAPPVIFDSRRRTARLRRSETRFAGADFLHVRAAENAVHSLEALMRDWVPAASQHGMMTTETVLMSQSGTHVPVHLVLQAHRREDHGLEYFSIIARDLTEQHEREMTLRATEFRFRCLVD